VRERKGKGWLLRCWAKGLVGPIHRGKKGSGKRGCGHGLGPVAARVGNGGGAAPAGLGDGPRGRREKGRWAEAAGQDGRGRGFEPENPFPFSNSLS